MARLNVNPTRMELKKLKTRLSTAVRGHKLLKDKTDEMIRRFSALIKENKRLRDEAEAILAGSLADFGMARGLIPLAAAEKAFSIPSAGVEAEFSTGYVMSVEVPKITVKEREESSEYPYAFTEIPGEADRAVKNVSRAVEVLLRLAEVEKSAEMLSFEIERSKRRVNALEYVMIPNLEETIAYVRSKLDENERAAAVRLMKVKSMIDKRG